MELHNTVEDKVIPRVNEIFDALEKEGNPGKYCTCNQCRMDTVCYVLNRMPPQYILSNRGASRTQGEGLEHQQQIADMTTLIHEGIRQVNHNQRPNVNHNHGEASPEAGDSFPVYNVPTIMGRIFDGNSFAPLSNIYVELLWNGQPVPQKDNNWQNPYRIVSNTEGAFSFWPAADRASAAGKHKIFEYTLRVTAAEFETLTHFFKIPVASEMQEVSSFSLARTFKLPDLYMFPPGESEKNGYLG